MGPVELVLVAESSLKANITIQTFIHHRNNFTGSLAVADEALNTSSLTHFPGCPTSNLFILYKSIQASLQIFVQIFVHMCLFLMAVTS
jgi:hypothetical protein